METNDLAQPLAEWLDEIAPDDSVAAVARKSGIPQRTLALRVKNGAVTPQEVILIARAYNQSVVAALEQFAYITEDEVRAAAHELIASEVPLSQLLRAALTRLDGLREAMDVVYSDESLPTEARYEYLLTAFAEEWDGRGVGKVPTSTLLQLAAHDAGYDPDEEAAASQGTP